MCDTKVYVPSIRALLGIASHFCEVVVHRGDAEGVVARLRENERGREGGRERERERGREREKKKKRKRQRDRGREKVCVFGTSGLLLLC